MHTCTRLLEHDVEIPYTTTERSVSGTTGPVVEFAALTQVGFLVAQHVEIEVHSPHQLATYP